MPATCKLIAKTVLGSAATLITFSGIPNTYTDLLCKMSTRSQNTGGTVDDIVTMYFNGTTTGYSGRRIFGLGTAGLGSDTISNNNGGTAGSRILAGGTAGSSAAASVFGNGQVYIPNYAGGTNKSVVGDGFGENTSGLAVIIASSGIWNNTAAITSITFDLYYSFAAGFSAGSSFYLYGITKS